MTLTLYGLKTCDTCRKALKALAAAGHEAVFVDLRGEADLVATLPGWLGAVGPRTLVNRASTTWRGLSDAERAEAETPEGAKGLLLAYPALIKRPVIEANGRIFIGFSAETRSALGV